MKFTHRIAALIVGLALSTIVFAGLETATYIHELVATNPVGATDPKSQGDDHVRMIKATLLNTFANVDGPVTSSHTELNILDGVTASASELNIMDGVTASTAELNVTDGILASTAELNFVDGVTSAIQTQLDGKLATNGNGSAVTNINASNISSGTISADRLPITLLAGAYTPTLTAVANCSALSNSGHMYSRVGSVVTVSGTVSLTVTTNADTAFAVSLPVASNFTAAANATGAGSMLAVNMVVARVEGDATNDRLEIKFFPGTFGSSITVRYTAQYLIQ